MNTYSESDGTRRLRSYYQREGGIRERTRGAVLGQRKHNDHVPGVPPGI